jgi:hypothetical protein
MIAPRVSNSQPPVPLPWPSARLRAPLVTTPLGGGARVAVLAGRPEPLPAASTSTATASRRWLHPGSRQSATGAPIGEPHVTTGGQWSRDWRLSAGPVRPQPRDLSPHESGHLDRRTIRDGSNALSDDSGCFGVIANGDQRVDDAAVSPVANCWAWSFRSVAPALVGGGCSITCWLARTFGTRTHCYRGSLGRMRCGWLDRA